MTAFLTHRIAFLGCLLAVSFTALGAVDPVVGRINDEPVTAAEYRLVMLREAPNVFSHLKATHDLDDHAGYWQDGGEPLSLLRNAVRIELVRVKVFQALARDRGLIKDTGFGVFLEDHATENARREEAVSKGEVIYGPRNYSVAALYYVRMGELAFRLTDLLAKEAEPAISDESVEEVYRERRSEFGEKSLSEVKTPIRAWLAKTRAEKQLEALCAVARVEMNVSELQKLVPRVDAPAGPAGGEK
jgi:hypothetical protein